MKDKFVLDSSIWVEMDRNNQGVLDVVSPLISKNRVCLVDVIAVEVLRGTKTKKDYRCLSRAFADFSQITTTWDKVSLLAFDVARGGFNPPLIDLYIAQAVREHHKILITQDRHFEHISKIKKLQLIMV